MLLQICYRQGIALMQIAGIRHVERKKQQYVCRDGAQAVCFGQWSTTPHTHVSALCFSMNEPWLRTQSCVRQIAVIVIEVSKPCAVWAMS